MNETAAPSTHGPVVVPALQRWSAGHGTVAVADGCQVHWNHDSLAELAHQLVEEIAEVAGISATASGQNTAGQAGPAALGELGAGVNIVLSLNPAVDFGTDHATADQEGYVLRVGNGVVLEARTLTGIFWGTRSLLQMLLASRELPCGTAVDWPNYPVRGFMLDVGRRFSQTAFLSDMVRYMGWFKLNTFMVHLNDNEIAKDTKRSWDVAQAAFRLESENPQFAGLAATDGSYTRAQWDALEDLAAAHHVNLIPEIDVPAHARSLIKWKPELGLNGGDSDMLDLSRPEATELVKELFSEFVPWFRSPVVHFGADEYAKDHEPEYRQFFNGISAHLRSLGKAPMAWGSLSTMANGAGHPESGYSRDVTICSWNNDWYSGQAAVADGYNIINTNDDLLYIVPFADYYHGGALDGQLLFDTWEPHVFGEGKNLYPQHPQLLGAASALWNDLVLKDYDEHVMHAMMEPAFGLLAQKMWRGVVPGMDYDTFMTRSSAVSRWPGREFLK
ncbi:beta-N-acetylhexosaminidase [Arthrobacter psychrochitiniphilus]|uniref:beta-N-acetylhexosaminidase n=1 Tax=Arthrobacter psychrochitiniphilus TaxID=291045 RepID=UPI003F7CCFF1